MNFQHGVPLMCGSTTEVMRGATANGSTTRPGNTLDIVNTTSGSNAINVKNTANMSTIFTVADAKSQSVAGILGVTGNTTLSGTLRVTGITTLSGKLSVGSMSSDSFSGSVSAPARTLTGTGGSVITLPSSYFAVPGTTCLRYVHSYTLGLASSTSTCAYCLMVYGF